MWPERFDITANYAYFRPVGTMSLDKAVGLINDAIMVARQRGVRKLLVETRGLCGFNPPTIAERFYFIRNWAETSGGLVRLVVVARPEMIDSQKIGVTVASNYGMASDVFASEPEAATWLQSA